MELCQVPDNRPSSVKDIITRPALTEVTENSFVSKSTFGPLIFIKRVRLIHLLQSASHTDYQKTQGTCLCVFPVKSIMLELGMYYGRFAAQFPYPQQNQFHCSEYDTSGKTRYFRLFYL